MAVVVAVYRVLAGFPTGSWPHGTFTMGPYHTIVHSYSTPWQHTELRKPASSAGEQFLWLGNILDQNLRSFVAFLEIYQKLCTFNNKLNNNFNFNFYF